MNREMSNQMNPFFVGGGMGMGGGAGGMMMGMDPATNNQPLQFNTNKGKPPMAIPGEQLKDVDLRAKPDRHGDDMLGEPGMGGLGGMSLGGWGPMMAPGMAAAAMGDPSMMMNFSQYGFMGTPLPMASPDGGGPMMSGQKEIITLKSAVLYPPPPNAPPPSLRERPPGCRTIFVGGLPETITEDIMRDVFENCGSITSIRLSKKNFAHIRFDFEESVEKAIYLSGYRIKIDNKDDKPNTGRLHVDYAQARDDLYEWECKARTFAREERHRIRVEEERLRPPSPPPITHYSDHEAAVLMDNLKSEEGFVKASQILATWLSRGDCNRRTSNTFYSLVQAVNSHVRRLMADKAQHDEELAQMKLKFRLRMEGILRQFEQIEQVFALASKQKVWDHFSKAQRKNLETWRKQAQDIRSSQQEEYFRERDEAEMEMSDDDDNDSGPMTTAKKRKAPEPTPMTPEQAAISAQDWAAMSQTRIENENLKMQLEAYKNEVELLKAESANEESKQVKALQQALQGMQKQLIAAKDEIKKAEEELKHRALKAEENGVKTETNEEEGSESKEEDQAKISSSVHSLTEREAKIIGILSTFLHVHPFGASVDYIWSYLSRLEPRLRTSEVEDILERFPKMFQLEVSGVGASLEKRWKFVGFDT